MTANHSFLALASLSVALSSPLAATASGMGEHGHTTVDDSVIQTQNKNLTTNSEGKGFGPQSPRDITVKAGTNPRSFATAPSYKSMNLCNIHFHANAEHRGGQFMKFAGNGDGNGFQTGFVYSGKLSKAEKTPLEQAVCASEHGELNAGDTIEVHYVHSSAQVEPGATLGACLSESVANPQLRVEAQVFVLVNNTSAADFGKLVEVGKRNGYSQALNIPRNTGNPIRYAGSTTGPAYNEKASPLQVSWSVRPQVVKVSAQSVGKWCEGNVFKEDHAHGVRNLVKSPVLLSPIQ